MSDVFSIVRIITRNELDRHQKRFLGITVTAPKLQTIDGKLEYVCDVRVEAVEGWGLIQNVIVSQWAIGAVADMNVPVLCERSEAGQITIIARSVVRLPDIRYTTHSLADLGLLFMSTAEEDEAGVWRDGFGFPVLDPTTETGATTEWRWTNDLIPFNAEDFIFGQSPFGSTDPKWTATTET
jgi:hypothetical protein